MKSDLNTAEIGTVTYDFSIFLDDAAPLLSIRPGISLADAMAAVKIICSTTAEIDEEIKQGRMSSPGGEWILLWLVSIAQAFLVSAKDGVIDSAMD